MFKTGVAALALTLTVAPAIVSPAAADDTIYDRISAYLTDYTKVLDGNSAALTYKGYQLATPVERSRIQIVAGRLVMVAEKMMVNGSDQRAERWTGFISNLPGPLCDMKEFDLKDYAATDKMRLTITKLQSAVCVRY